MDDLNVASTPPEWHQYLSDDVKADPSLKPIIDKIPERDTPSFIKSALHAQKRLGSAISLPNGDSKPEDLEKWRNENLPRLQKAGVIQGAPATPDAYEINPPKNLPDGLTWPPEFVAEAKGALHKAGFTQDQVKVAMDLHMKALGGMAGQAQSLAVAKDEAAKALQTKWGDKYEQNVLIADKGAEKIFANKPEVLEKFKESGLLSQPEFMETMQEIGALFMEGDANIGGGTSQGMMDAEKEALDIMNNPSNPRHELYAKGDKATHEHVQALYAKAYHGKTIEI